MRAAADRLPMEHEVTVLRHGAVWRPQRCRDSTHRRPAPMERAAVGADGHRLGWCLTRSEQETASRDVDLWTAGLSGSTTSPPSLRAAGHSQATTDTPPVVVGRKEQFHDKPWGSGMDPFRHRQPAHESGRIRPRAILVRVPEIAVAPQRNGSQVSVQQAYGHHTNSLAVDATLLRPPDRLGKPIATRPQPRVPNAPVRPAVLKIGRLLGRLGGMRIASGRVAGLAVAARSTRAPPGPCGWFPRLSGPQRRPTRSPRQICYPWRASQPRRCPASSPASGSTSACQSRVRTT